MKGTIYINGSIITMNDNAPSAESIVESKGKILFVGEQKEALKYKNKGFKVIDLKGNTLLPGFIDGHSHFLYSALGQAMICNLSHPPVGDIESIDDIINKMKKFILDRKINPGAVVMGMGYDQSLLKEKRIPTKDDLDEISKEHKIIISHQSGHVAVFNSLILEDLGVNADTPDPDGGAYLRYEGTTIPNGIAEETAMMQGQLKYFPRPKIWQFKKVMKEGQKLYTSNGITTAQDGGLKKMIMPIFKLGKLFNWFDIDIRGYYFADNKDDVTEYLSLKDKYQKGRFKLAGMKVLLDGSPQAKTAWLSKPYHIVPEGKPKDYSGYPMIPDENQVQEIYNEVVKNKLQILTHTNGDEASEQLIRCYTNASEKHQLKEDLRPVMIHAQTVRKEQLERMLPINMIPSFFQMHTYFWGDWHLDSVLGPERGHNISPTRWAADMGIKFNVHSDTPVLPPNTMYMLWTAVNRKTRSMRTIGEDHKLTVMEALKSQTIWAAYAYFEENIKGSLEEGKLADFVILNQNPLEIDPMLLRDIKILETIKEGKTVFKTN